MQTHHATVPASQTRAAGQADHASTAVSSKPRLHAIASFALLLLTVPAFYLSLAGTRPWHGWLGRGLYIVVAVGLAGQLMAAHERLRPARRIDFWRRHGLDAAISAGALAAVGSAAGDWSSIDWVLHMALAALVSARLVLLVRTLLDAGHRIITIALIGGITLALAGLGFYWIEPTVSSYADGLWLAFVSGATVGYGDIVPTTPASRVFAAFMVVLGYALLSLATASVAALFIGDEERQRERALHRDIVALRREVQALHERLAMPAPGAPRNAVPDQGGQTSNA